MKIFRFIVVAAATAAAAACAPPKPAVPPRPVRIPGSDTIPIPLTDLGDRTYKGLEGGLFPSRSNTEPADHGAIGIAHRNVVQRLDVNGRPSATGRYVLMSVGGADASGAWCSPSSAPPCNSWSFTGRAISDPLVNHSALVIVNGAARISSGSAWSSPASANYNRIRDTRLAPLGLSEKQVQVIWMAVADTTTPVMPLTATSADGAAGVRKLAETIRALKTRYPNLQMLFISSPRYGGYYAGGEPQAYEAGFIVRWTIESQIDELRGSAPNVYAGSLDPSGAAVPWISWGPYLWANGGQPRADGLSWARADFDSAGLGSSRQGEQKVGGIVFDFFRSSVYTRCWFLAGAVCN